LIRKYSLHFLVQYANANAKAARGKQNRREA